MQTSMADPLGLPGVPLSRRPHRFDGSDCYGFGSKLPFSFSLSLEADRADLQGAPAASGAGAGQAEPATNCGAYCTDDQRNGSAWRLRRTCPK